MWCSRSTWYALAICDGVYPQTIHGSGRPGSTGFGYLSDCFSPHQREHGPTDLPIGGGPGGSERGRARLIAPSSPVMAVTEPASALGMCGSFDGAATSLPSSR